MTFISLMLLHAIVLGCLYFAIRQLTPALQDRVVSLARFRRR